MNVLAIDAGTTGVTALVVSTEGKIRGRGYAEFRQHYPQPGWVEHLPEGIWQATLSATRQALAGGATVQAVGVANQRETLVVWDRRTLAAPRRAIVWQDRRTAPLCARMREAGHEPMVTELTGLRLDPYFTATKLSWIAANDEPTWAAISEGNAVAGTVDSYLIARLTAGRRHVTDASNASRTLLYDIRTGQWSAELCDLFGVPMSALPEVVPSYGVVGQVDPEQFVGLDVPIAGIAGDQQAALFGQACFAAGDTKCTYGTGSFLLVNTGKSIVPPRSGLLSTVAWQEPDGELTYALEGAIFVTGAAVQWLRDGLGIIDTAPQTEALAGTVPDSGGVVFVPALTGLGAPDWDPDARGTILGITRGTTRAHLIRATLEAIAYEVRDVFDLMTSVTGHAATVMKADGGASANNLLMQLQADQMQIAVERPVVAETTALGAGFLAGLGTGMWSSATELAGTWQLDRRFEPGPQDETGHNRWRAAVQRAKGWATS